MRTAPALLVPLVIVAGCSSARSDTRPGCAARQLGVFAVTQGGGGATIGDVRLRNDGAADCWLRGRPDLSVLDERGVALRIRVVPPKRAGAMRLRPHDAAEVIFQWHNWCRPTAPAALRLVLPGGGTIRTKADIGRPRCDAPTRASTLVLSTFGLAT